MWNWLKRREEAKETKKEEARKVAECAKESTLKIVEKNSNFPLGFPQLGERVRLIYFVNSAAIRVAEGFVVNRSFSCTVKGEEAVINKFAIEISRFEWEGVIGTQDYKWAVFDVNTKAWSSSDGDLVLLIKL
jgi:hypothetical protein